MNSRRRARHKKMPKVKSLPELTIFVRLCNALKANLPPKSVNFYADVWRKLLRWWLLPSKLGRDRKIGFGAKDFRSVDANFFSLAQSDEEPSSGETFWLLEAWAWSYFHTDFTEIHFLQKLISLSPKAKVEDSSNRMAHLLVVKWLAGQFWLISL